MTELARQTARFLLDSKAVILRPEQPFIWASGWQSPIYCDNRVTLSYPEIRSYIKDAFRKIIGEQFGSPDLIAGVATGAIAQGALVAEAMELPFVYVRPSVKEHGRKNQVEGRMEAGQGIVVVEDLVSTGGSSLKAVEALREAGGKILGMTAIFTYGFSRASEAFQQAGVELITLSSYHDLLEVAMESGYINEAQAELLGTWRKDPENWTGA